MHLLTCLFVVLAAGACSDSPAGPTENASTISSIELTPPAATVQMGGTVQFSATGKKSDGSTADLKVAYAASGGTITSSGLFTAPGTTGTFTVTAKDVASDVSASASITVSATPPAGRLVRVSIAPATASVQASGTVQFTGNATMNDGSTFTVPLTFSATGGIISASGLYTASAAAGTYRVIATDPGTGLSDTASVTVTTGVSWGGSYTTVVSDDWKGYKSSADLKAANKFWWWATGEDVYQNVSLVQDPTFGQVVQVKFKGGQDYHHAPQMTQKLPRPMDKMWLRVRAKFGPGFTTVGSTPAGWANSHKFLFWHWNGYDGRGQIEYSNTDQYIPAWYVNTSSGQKLSYSESPTPGSASSFGRVSGEWTDGEWYEFVVYYEKTSATTARQHWWRRKLTSGGKVVASNPWTYFGLQYSGSTTPQVSDFQLGGNRNKDISKDMFIYWGPWEVVDGTQFANPWSMPYQNGATSGASGPTQPTPPPTSTPTLTRVVMSPKTATVLTGDTVRVRVTGEMSDGSTSAVTVKHTATGGTIDSRGLYTAGSTAGTFKVIATEPNSGLADTATVTVTKTPVSVKLAAVVLTPKTASTQTGGKVQFSASGKMSDGTTGAVSVSYTATGGTISSSGLYTAGSVAGTFRVIAKDLASGLADTASVTVSAVAPPPPPPPSTGGSYSKLVGDDWKGYASASDLQSRGYFQSGELRYVSLVSDATFGKVVRTTQPAGSNITPTLTAGLGGGKGKVWFRWRMRYSPNWTDGGSPSSGARTFKVAGLDWSDFNGHGGFTTVNTDYVIDFSVRDRKTNQYVRYSESTTPGSGSSFGRVGSERTDGEWYEFVMYYEKTSATTARQHWWRRKLTSRGQIAPGAWTYYGLALSGATTPSIATVRLGMEKSKTTPSTQYIDWGPWEVVDGSAYSNPWGMSAP